MRVLIPAGGRPLGGWAAGQRVSLEQSEVHHLRVRRAADYENVEILDGAGFRGNGCLVQLGGEWAVDINTAEQQPRPPELTMAVATGDRERFSWMVEKSVELGV